MSFLTTEAALVDTTSHSSAIPTMVIIVVMIPILAASFLFSMNRIKALLHREKVPCQRPAEGTINIAYLFLNIKSLLVDLKGVLTAAGGGIEMARGEAFPPVAPGFFWLNRRIGS